MSSHGETRRLAFEAACTLAAAAQRPTIRSIRAHLGGGGQQAISDGLNDWVDEAARRFTLPGVPEALCAQVVALWDLAGTEADQRWAQARQTLEQQLTESEAQRSRLQMEVAEAKQTIGSQAETIAAQGAQIAALTDAQDALNLTLEARNAELDALRGELTQTTTALQQRTDERNTETRRAEREAQRADATKVSLDDAHSRILALQVELSERSTQAALLEQARDSAAKALAPLHTELERAQEVIAQRDEQILALTLALGREQAGREADSQHWLNRLEERQAEVAAARNRETLWNDERQRFQQEIAKLRREHSIREHMKPEINGSTGS